MVKYVLLTVVAAMMLTACGGVNTPIMGGFIYSDLKAPFTATSSTSAAKTGEAECVGYLSLVALGDCSIETAKRNGGISEVTSVDYKASSILGVVNKFTIIVTGK